MGGMGVGVERMGVGRRKDSVEQPALKRRGQEKPKLEALLHQSPWRKTSCPVGRHVKMPAFDATTNDGCDAGFMETNKCLNN